MAYCCLVERYIQLAGRALQFADFDLPTVGGFAPLPHPLICREAPGAPVD